MAEGVVQVVQVVLQQQTEWVDVKGREMNFQSHG